MCWKQEWASTINNLQHAIEHVQKAQDKLIKRRERNEAALKNKWKTDFYEETKIKARIEKNRSGQEQCEKLIADLKDWQDVLFKMIHEYGISKSDDPKRVYKLMGKYPFADKLKEYEIVIK